MFEKVIEVLNRSDVKNVAILTHVNPDCDALGSSFAMKKIIEKKWDAKTVTIVLLKKLENENPIDFAYDNYEIFNEEKKYLFDAVISVDCGNLSRIDKAKIIMENCNSTINIDHHQDNSGFAVENVICPEFSSTCEMVYDFLIESDVELDKSIATNIYVGICTDTGCFKYTSTSAKTHLIISKLMEYGVENGKITKLLFDTISKEELLMQAYLTSKIEFYLDDKLAIIVVTKEIMDKFSMDEDKVNGIVGIIRRIKGVDVAISVKEAENDYKLSLRSEIIDVSHIAHGIGGGGHIKASGAKVNMDIDKLREYLINTTKGMYK